MTYQLNRGQSSRSSTIKSGVDNLAGADQIGMDASIVVGVTPGPGNASDIMRSHTVLKNREGRKNFTWHTNFLFEPRMNFEECSGVEGEEERLDMVRSMR
jgi:hypothetical protein